MKARIDELLDENERLKAEPLRKTVSDTLLVAMKRADEAEARIDAALALYNQAIRPKSQPEVVPVLAQEMAKALRGEQ